MKHYYNEIEAYPAQWMRNLMAAGHIPNGVVDERDIRAVRPADLAGYTQCHFFAGIGGWAEALRLAGWPVDRPVWTGSCPCQPFSAAGEGKGQADERHLWPDWFDLIRVQHPVTVAGEQVANAIGHGWLDGVFADLEAEGYSCGAIVLGAHSVGAPHIRQRLYWVANAASERFDRRQDPPGTNGWHGIEDGGAASRVADTNGRKSGNRELQCSGKHRQQQENSGTCRLEYAASDGRQQRRAKPGWGLTVARCSDSRLVHAQQPGPEGSAGHGHNGNQPRRIDSQPDGSTPAAGSTGFWSEYDLIPCTDCKSRRIEPGSFPLAHGALNRVGRLRGYGNAIVPQVAAEFIRAFMEVEASL